MMRIEHRARPWWRRASRGARAYRRPLAALAAAAAVVVLGAAVESLVSPATSQVVVAARPIGGGSVLVGSDVRLARWPVDLLPDGALIDAADAVGGTVTFAVARGEPLTAARVGPPGGAHDLQGRVNVVVGLADAWAAAMAAAGVRLDLYPTTDGWGDAGPTQPQPLARGAVVVRVLGAAAAEPATGPLGIPPDSAASGGASALVVAVTPDEAAALSTLAGQGVMISTSLATPADP